LRTTSCLGSSNECSLTGIYTFPLPPFCVAAELGAAQEQVAVLTAQLAALADAKAGAEGAQAEVAAQLAQLQVGGDLLLLQTSGNLLLLLLPSAG
jgi:hypothetical protein